MTAVVDPNVETHMTQPSAPQDSLVISYLRLRRAVGYLGLALPFVLALGAFWLHGQGIQSSISAYYHTGMRDVFVGILCAIGIFLLSYRGHERKDRLAGDAACLFALGVALFPTAPDVDPTSRQKLIGGVHLVFASLFFLTLAYFSLCLFTLTDPMKPPTPRKLQRNRVYRACGYTMLAALALILAITIAPAELSAPIRSLQPVFWLEALAVVAFGLSWLTKGERILQDEGE